MHLYLIGVYLDEHSSAIGYRMIDTDSVCKYKDVLVKDIVNTLEATNIKIENVKVSNHALVGKYYSLKTLPNLNNVYDVQNKKVILQTRGNVALLANASGCLAQVAVANLSTVANIINYNYATHELKCLKEQIPSVNKQATVPNKGNICSRSNIDAIMMSKDTEITLEQFDEYMRLHNCNYKIYTFQNHTEINNIKQYDGESALIIDLKSVNFKVLHLPKNTVRFNYCRASKSRVDIDLIVFNKEIQKINNLSFGNGTHIKEVYFQQGNDRQISFLHFLEGAIIEKTNLPNIRLINNIYNNCEIHNIKINSIVNHIEGSFNDTVFKIDKLEVYNITKIADSFKKSSDNSSDIEIEKLILSNECKIIRSFSNTKIKEVYAHKVLKCDELIIKGSFNNCGIQLYDCKNVNFTDIESSFNKSQNQVTIYTGEQINLYNSFANVEVLNVIAKSGWVTIWNHFGIDTKKLRMTFSKRASLEAMLIQSLGDYYPNIEVDTSNLSILPSEAYDLGQDFLKDSNNIKMLNSLLKGIDTVNDCAFQNTYIKYFDTQSFPLVDTLPNNCFEESKLETIIIRDNIKKIGDDAFKDCLNLEKLVFLTTDAVLEKNTLRGIPRNCVISVYENSKIHKAVKNKDFIVQLIPNGTDLEHLLDHTLSSEKEIATYRLLNKISNPDWQSGENIKHIGFIDKFSKEVDRFNNEEYTKAPVSELDTSKFISNIDVDTLPKAFINLCNLITQHTNNYSDLYTDEFKRFYKNSENQAERYKAVISFMDSNGCIKPINEYRDTYIVILGSETFTGFALGVIISNKLVYLTTIVPNAILRDMWMSKIRSNNKFFIIDDVISKFVYTGDSLSYCYKIGNINTRTLPVGLISQAYENLLLIGLVYKDKAISTVVKRDDIKLIKLESINCSILCYRALYYSCSANKFIECNCSAPVAIGLDNPDRYSRIKIHELNDCVVRAVYDVSDIDKINPEYFRFIRAALNDKYGYNLLRRYSFGTDKINSLKATTNNDRQSTTQLQELANAVYNSKSDKFEDLPVELIEWIANSELSLHLDVSIHTLQSNIGQGNILKTDADKAVIKFNPNIVAIAPINTKGYSSDKSLSFCTNRMEDFYKLTKMLYIMGYSQQNSDIRPLEKITNDRINIDNFYCYKVLYSHTFSADGLKFHLAFDRGSFESYIISEYLDTDFYTLFRFKSLNKALDFFSILEENKNGYINLDAMTGLVRHIGNGQASNTNVLTKLRDCVIQGYSDEYPVLGDECNIWNDLTKQTV